MASAGIVTLASFTCQRRDALVGRTQRNQWLAEFESGAGNLENPLFLADVTMPFETLSERLSKELEDTFNQMAQLMGRAQKQQYEIMALFGKQAAAMEALADLVAKVRNDDVERNDQHATAIEQLLQGQMKIAQFTEGLATQYAQLFKALSNRLDEVEWEAFGPNFNQPPSTPPLN